MSNDNKKKYRSILPRGNEQSEEAKLENLIEVNRLRNAGVGVFIGKDKVDAETFFINELKKGKSISANQGLNRPRYSRHSKELDDFIVSAYKESNEAPENFVVRSVSEVITKYSKNKTETEKLFRVEIARKLEKEERKILGRSLAYKSKAKKEDFDLEDYGISFFIGFNALRSRVGKTK